MVFKDLKGKKKNQTQRAVAEKFQALLTELAAEGRYLLGVGKHTCVAETKKHHIQSRQGTLKSEKKITQLYFIKTKSTHKTHEKIELKCLEHVVMETVE